MNLNVRVLVVMFGALSFPAAGQEDLWTRQFGTGAYDHGYGLAIDGTGGVFIVGSTTGDMGGDNAGGYDAWIAHFDHTGTRTWIRQLGSAGEDHASAVAHHNGSVYIAGQTTGNLAGSNAGNTDAWIACYEPNGIQRWIRQFGTTGYDGGGGGLTTDGGGGVFVSGGTSGALGGENTGDYDVWLARYDSTGDRTWIIQFGSTRYDEVGGLAADGDGGTYLAGTTDGPLGGYRRGKKDVWLARYDADGDRTWIRQFGTDQYDGAHAVAADGPGGMFISGVTHGDLGGENAGDADPWLARYTSTGTRTWIRQIGTPEWEYGSALSPNGSGGVLVGGGTNGDLGGANEGHTDSWLAEYDSVGTRTWLIQFGTNGTEGVWDIALDADVFFVSGSTSGNKGNSGMTDAWLSRRTDPAPTAVPLSGYVIDRGTRISGNLFSMMLSDPYRLKVASASGTTFETVETVVRAKSDVLAPVRFDVRTETRATTTDVQTRIALFNLDTNIWNTVASFAQPTVDTVQVVENIPNPQRYIRQSDGLIRIRVQSFRAAWRGPFQQWIDHVEIAVSQ